MITNTMRRSIGATMVFAAAMLIPGATLAAQGPDVGQPAPVVSVADLNGKPVRIALTSGKQAAVVEFWATWCELCKALLPSMKAAAQKYGDRVDFYGVNVTVNDPKAHVVRYVAQNHPPFVPLYDDHGTAVRAFGALATSYVVIIDRHGKVAYTGDGADQDIPALLGKVLAK
ncbi:MAG TPA: TlpA disulfide reductase family protein [Gemmatimonadales bacterium]